MHSITFVLAALLLAARADYTYAPIDAAMVLARDAILNVARASNVSWTRLAYMCDTFGPRFSGSPGLEAALDWAAATAAADGFVVTQDPVAVPRWVRGAEYAVMRSPRNKTLHFAGLGGSIGTGGGEIVAPALVVASFDDLSARNATGETRGKIIVYNEPFLSYGFAAGYRYDGATRAASAGGVAALVRSAGPFGIQTPHTGGSGTAAVPSGCISGEDASQLQRMQDRGQPVVLALYMEAQTLADAPSRNLVIDLVGSERPQEFVVIGGHSDSWDLAEGAMDDGGGVMAALEALRLVKAAGLAPRRTLRAVWWVNEENGSRGARQFAVDYLAALPATSFMIESDEGAFAPYSLSAFAHGAALNQLRILAPLLDPLGAGNVSVAGGPPAVDIGPACSAVLPDGTHAPCGAVSVRDSRDARTPWRAAQNNVCDGYEDGAAMPPPNAGISDAYFWYHHTAGDVIDVVDASQLEAVAAFFAIWATTIANLPELLPRAGPVPPLPPPPPPPAAAAAAAPPNAALAASLTAAAVLAAVGGLAAWHARRRGWACGKATALHADGGARAPALGGVGAAYAALDAAGGER
jgi:carboxypeptidase Q